jgi:hypothetical protein
MLHNQWDENPDKTFQRVCGSLYLDPLSPWCTSAGKVGRQKAFQILVKISKNFPAKGFNDA